jgi:ABC-type glycerol-3-phosphate transport system permease component
MVSQFDLQMADAFVAALPTLVVYALFGEQFANGAADSTTRTRRRDETRPGRRRPRR